MPCPMTAKSVSGSHLSSSSREFSRATLSRFFRGLLVRRVTGEPAATCAPNPYLRKLKSMKRVVIVGRGASGKSTLARHLGDITGLPVTEVDKIFWQPGLIATPRQQRIEMQEQLVTHD